MPLITTARATELVPNFPAADTAVMDDIVIAASSLVEKWCNRTFAVTAYDELIDGTGHSNILLSNYPLTQIDRIMFNPIQVMSIQNTKTTTSRASFRLDATALYLASSDSGTTYSHTLTRSGYNTLADLAAGVNAFGGEGWKALALGNFAPYAVSDLFSPQGGSEVRWTGQGYLWHHAYGMPYIHQNPAIGEVVSVMQFQRGYQNYRAIYSAGFKVIPPEVQQAVAELAAAVYQNRDTDSNLASESLGGYSYSALTEKTFDNLSIASKYALHQYKNIRIPKNVAY